MDLKRYDMPDYLLEHARDRDYPGHWTLEYEPGHDSSSPHGEDITVRCQFRDELDDGRSYEASSTARAMDLWGPPYGLEAFQRAIWAAMDEVARTLQRKLDERCVRAFSSEKE